MGDSLIRHVTGYGFSTLCYPGKKTDKISEIVINGEHNELLLNSKNIIVAFGTNNICKDKPYTIANNLILELS